MASYLLIPGAGGGAWYWHRVVAELERRGHEALAVDLPAGDDSAGLTEYADVAVAAAGDRRRLVVVGQSLGAFTAPLVCDRVDSIRLVLLNPMVGLPGESPGQWWAATGSGEARARYAAESGRDPDAAFDPVEDFFHDVPPDIAADALVMGEPAQSDTPFGTPWPLARWPQLPIYVIQGRDDRLFPLAFQRRVVAERLGIAVDDIPGGHLLALSRPVELVDQLESYEADEADEAYEA